MLASFEFEKFSPSSTLLSTYEVDELSNQKGIVLWSCLPKLLTIQLLLISIQKYQKTFVLNAIVMSYFSLNCKMMIFDFSSSLLSFFSYYQEVDWYFVSILKSSTLSSPCEHFPKVVQKLLNFYILFEVFTRDKKIGDSSLFTCKLYSILMIDHKTLALIILTVLRGLSPLSVFNLLIYKAVSIPFMTLPNIVCLLSSQTAWFTVMKNWEPLVFAPLFAIARTYGRSNLYFSGRS